MRELRPARGAWDGVKDDIIVKTSEQMGFFGQLGLRRVSGLAEVDDLIGTGLDAINDKSARWTLPFIAGVQFRF